jgi:hypothetical protein
MDESENTGFLFWHQDKYFKTLDPPEFNSVANWSKVLHRHSPLEAGSVVPYSQVVTCSPVFGFCRIKRFNPPSTALLAHQHDVGWLGMQRWTHPVRAEAGRSQAATTGQTWGNRTLLAKVERRVHGELRARVNIKEKR